MKKIYIVPIITILIFSSCNSRKPLDYYNMAVGAGNTSTTFFQMERRLDRLGSGMDLDSQDLAASVISKIAYNEKLLDDLNGLLGNEDSDPMIKAAVAYLEFDIDCAKNPKTLEVFKVVGNAKTFGEASTKLKPLEAYLDSIYVKKNELWTAYDYEVTQYAERYGIDMKFLGE